MWGLFDQNVGLEQIKTEWSILSFAASWLDSTEVIQRDTGGRGPSKVRDDRALLYALWTLLDEADIVVVQNGKRFDLPKINARMVMHGLTPYSPVRVVDTLEIAKRRFGFTSNKLAWITKHLTPSTQKLDHREFPGFELWKQCLADNPRAWRVMRKYNRRDVVGLKPVYLKLRPWADGHPNVATYVGDSVPRCPKCGSTNLKRNGSSCTQVGQYARYFCRDCKGFSRGRLMLNTKAQRGALLGN